MLLGPFAVALHDQSLPKATVEWIIDKLSKPLDKPTDPVADASLALIIGFGQQQIVQSSVLVDIAFGLVFCGTLTATVIATLEPDAGSVPKDFLQKATLSNMAQDMTQPQGRLWSTALGLASVLSVVSMYTFWLYRSWQPFVGDNNPLHSPVLQSSLERRLRIAWALAPNVGFVLAAMVPSLSDVAGYEIVLTAVHNVSAPLSMLFLMVMETIQLGYGENAFAYFFSQDATPLYGPLTKYQRMRVCLLVEAWISGTIFVAVSCRQQEEIPHPFIFFFPAEGAVGARSCHGLSCFSSPPLLYGDASTIVTSSLTPIANAVIIIIIILIMLVMKRILRSSTIYGIVQAQVQGYLAFRDFAAFGCV